MEKPPKQYMEKSRPSLRTKSWRKNVLSTRRFQRKNNRPADRVTLSFGINGYDTVGHYANVFVPNVEELDFQAEAIIGYYTDDCVLIGKSSG